MPGVFAREADLITALRCHLARRGFGVVEAVPTLNRCIDLVAWRAGPVWAVECKLRDWRCGLVQANRYLWAAPYAWLCLPSRTWPKRLQEEARECGIGVLLCDAYGIGVLVRPRKSRVLWPPACEWLDRAIERRRRDILGKASS